MITIGKATSADYYTSGAGVDSAVASYYLDAVTEGEPPGRWLGRGAARLGVAGDVEARDMHTLYHSFVDPVTGEQLGRRPAQFASVEGRVSTALAAEPDALPERQAEIRRSIERTDRSHTIGWDATFAIPKSVTVAHTAAQRCEIQAIRSGDHARAEEYKAIRLGIESAISNANDAGVAVLEDLATSRTGGGSGAPLQWVKTDGLVIASFFQHTNRSIDPHLHQHNVILNRVLCEDGVYRALDGRDLLAQRYAPSAVADRVLMEDLARMGFDSALNADGTARELTIVPEDVRAEFSTRRAQITAALTPHVEAFTARYGREPSAAELSAIKTAVQRTTRAAKTHDNESVEEMIDRMQARIVGTTGHTLQGIGEMLRLHVNRGPVPGRDFSPTAIVQEAVAACAARSATWGRANLMNEIELRLPVIGTAAAEARRVLEEFTDLGLASADVVQVTALDEADDPGTAQYRAPSAVRYAAAGTLAAEAALRRAAIERGGHALDVATVKEWLDEHAPTLGADQRAVIEGIATSPARLAVLVGPAGAGKSYTTGVLAEAWAEHSAGGRVIGLATSEVATHVLADDGITDIANISAFLTAHDRLDRAHARGHHAPDLFGDERWRLGPRDVVLVDEASMVATADLDAIRSRVEAAGARMILAGDPRQLAAVEAGGAMGLLDGHAETYTLTDVRRFTEPWERDASLALRAGDANALVDYDRHGRLVDAETVEDAIGLAVRGAVADRLEGHSTVVVAASNDLADRISAQVRDQLIALGQVQDGGGITLGRDGNTGSVGDQVMCRRNDHSLGVTNRARYTVIAITDTGDLVVQPLPRPGQATAGATKGTEGAPSQPGRTTAAVERVTLPAAYVAEHVQLAYAGTVHAAEGVTVDRSYFVTDGAAGPATQYVALTRGRDRNTAVVAVTTPGYDAGTAPAAVTDTGGVVRVDNATSRPTARAVLESGLENDDPAEAAATVTAERDHDRASSMVTIGGQIETQTRLACRHRMERHLDDLAAAGILTRTDRGRLAADQGSEYLSRLLRVAEQAGQDPRQVLTDAVTGGKSLDDADSIAQVLSHRITRTHNLDRADHVQPDTTTELPGNERAGVAELPGDITPDERVRLTGLRTRASARASQLGTEAAEDAPDWALLSLGPVPAATDVADRADWERRAGLVAAHREAVGWHHPEQPIGTLPGTTTTERRITYTAAWHALGQPQGQLTEAGMTDGRLRTRVRAWQNEQTWAPPNVDDALKGAELDREHARQDAAHADAHQRAEDAARHREHVEALDDRVARLTDAARARADWYRHTVIAHAHAEAARAELERRGIHPGREPDRTTAREWFAAEHQARRADDVHRTITEADVLDHERAAQAEDQGPTAAKATASDVASAPGPIDSRRLPEATAGASEPSHAPAAERDVQDEQAASGSSSSKHEMVQVAEPDPATPGSANRLGPSAGAAEVEALTASSRLAASVAADRDAEEAAHQAVDQERLAAQASLEFSWRSSLSRPDHDRK